MKSKLFLLACLVSLTGTFTSCSQSEIEDMEPVMTNDKSDFVEAPKCDGTVQVILTRGDGTIQVLLSGDVNSRAAATTVDIDRFTATRVDTKSDAFTLVSYHGRNKENIGLVQTVNPKTMEVISEIYLPDARVNFAQYRAHSSGNVVYIGVDRTGQGGVLCGILAIPVVDGIFQINNGAQDFKPYKVEGVSINCIKQTNGDSPNGAYVMAVASGGNNALGQTGLAGFTKFGISKTDPTKLTLLNQVVDANYRGYWFSYGTYNKSPIVYAYRTVDDGDLSYRIGVIKNSDSQEMFSNTVNDYFIKDYDNVIEEEVFREKGTTENYGRFTAISYVRNQDQSKYIIVSNGITKGKGTIKVYRYDQNGSDGPKLTLVDEWNKGCTCIGTEIRTSTGDYIFMGCGDGVYKVRLDFTDNGNNDKRISLVPVEKYKVTALTESGTLSSVNYIQIKGTGTAAKVHVAGGYEGYYVLDFNDSRFVPTDKRK